MGLSCRTLAGLLPLFVLLPFVSGCAQFASGDSGSSGARATIDTAMVDAAQPVAVGVENGPGAYLLQVGDKLDIRFFYSNELDQQLIIRPDGRISLQLIGEMQAAGVAPEELQQDIRERYTGILRRPEVTVIVTQFSPPKAFVSGEIKRPEEIVLTPGLTVLQAIARTGGFTPDAELENVVVLRYRKDQPPRFYRLNLEAFLDQGLERASDGSQSLECRPGGIPDSSSHQTGDMLSSEQIAPCSPFQGNLASDLQLMPFDIVYVPKTRIASVAEFFERYINNIIPLYRNLGLNFTYELSDIRIR